MYTQPIPAARGRRVLALALMLALGAPLAAHAGSVCQTTAASNPPASASGTAALACGDDAQAVDDDATAFGYGSRAGMVDTADPDGTEIHGANALAVGENAGALGDDDIALGDNSYAEGRDTPGNSRNDTNIAVGYSSNASGGDSIAMGYQSFTLAPAAGSPDAGQYGIALGTNAAVNAANTVAVGFDSNAAGRWSVDVGAYDTFAMGESSVVFGEDSHASGDGAVSLNSYEVKDNGIGVNNGNETGAYGISLLGNAAADSSISIGVNNGNGGVGRYTILIGTGAGTGGNNDATDSIGLGSATVTQADATAFGASSYATGGAGGTAAGFWANSHADYGSALGTYAYATRAGDVAIGSNAHADDGFAAGANVSASDGGVALGGWLGSACAACTTEAGAGSVALGDQAAGWNIQKNLTLLGSETGHDTGGVPPVAGVALGEGSIVERAAPSVSVGHAKAWRQIIHVAAATADTDAINVAQMQAALKAAGGGSGGVDMTQAKKYIDAGDAGTLTLANGYTDRQVGKMTVSTSTVRVSSRRHADSGDAAMLKSATAHADAGDAKNRGYADDQIKQALATAEHYAKTHDTVTLKSAKVYVDSRIGAIAGNGFADFRHDVNTRFDSQNRKLNRTGAIDAALAGMAVSAAASASTTRLGIALGGYHGETAVALGIQHAFGTRVALTLGAGIAGGGNHTVNLAIGIAL